MGDVVSLPTAKPEAARKIILCSVVAKPVLLAREPCSCGQVLECSETEAIRQLTSGHRVFADCPGCNAPVEFVLSRVEVPRPEPKLLVDLKGMPIK